MRTLIAALARLFPERFRRHFGPALTATFEDAWRERHGWRAGLRVLADLLRGAFLEHLAEVRRPERIPKQKGDRLMTAIWHDLRYARRTLSKSPGFTIVAVVTLALGIGANSAIYSVVDAVLVKGLPYPNASRLVFLNEKLPAVPFLNVAWPDFTDWRAQNQAFSEMAAFQPNRVTFAAAEGAKSVPAGWVSGSFFALLGAQPALGRTFNASDDRPGAPALAVLSYHFWRNELKGDAQIVGRQIAIEGAAYTVAGVLAPDFRFEPWTFDIFLPIGLRSGEPGFQNRGNHPGIQVIASLRPEVTPARARADMQTLMDRLAREFPESNRNESAVLTPIAQRLIGRFRAELLTMLGAVAFVLVIACANVAHLALARAAGRRREFSIRAAIGASRRRLTQQLLVESTLLALVSGALGLLLAYWGLPQLVALYPGEIPGLKSTHLDAAVLAVTLGVCLAASMLFGLAPLLESSADGIGTALKDGGAASAGRSGRRFRAALFVGEIAVALVLTIGSALLLRSLVAVLDVDPGFHADHLLALDIVHSGPPEGQLRFFEQAADRMAHLPGVESASAVMCPPMGGTCWTSPYAAAGHAAPPVMQRPWTALNMVLSGYFKTMGMKLKEGRFFTDQDDGRSGRIAVINEAMARRISPHGSAVGKTVDVTYAAGELLEVVGVVGDVKQFGLDQPVIEEVYVPAAQMPVNFMTVVMRTRQDPAALAHAGIAAIQDLDRGHPVAHVTSMTGAIAGSVARRRFAATLFGLFGVLALVLALVGVAGVMGYTVAQRMREFGIRIAMGAQPGQVSRMVLGHALRLTALGVALGLGAAWGLSRLLAGMLFGVEARDPATFAAVAILLAGAALGASLLPARRAARVDPTTALRYD